MQGHFKVQSPDTIACRTQPKAQLWLLAGDQVIAKAVAPRAEEEVKPAAVVEGEAVEGEVAEGEAAPAVAGAAPAVAGAPAAKGAAPAAKGAASAAKAAPAADAPKGKKG